MFLTNRLSWNHTEVFHDSLFLTSRLSWKTNKSKSKQTVEGSDDKRDKEQEDKESVILGIINIENFFLIVNKQQMNELTS